MRLWSLGLAALALALVACTGPPSKAPVIDRTRATGQGSRPVPQYKVVAKGDTLYAIAFATGRNYRDLAVWNGIQPPYLIYPGQRVRLTAPVDAGAAERRSEAVIKPSKRKKTSKSISSRSRPESRPAAPKPKPDSSAGAKPTRRAKRQGEFERLDKVSRWQWPVKGILLAGFNSTGRTGINIGGGVGKPVAAAADGQVVYSGGGLRGYGRLIIVKHSRRYLSAYAHNNRIMVHEGQTVRRGDVIAEMGRSGADSVMLHFEIRRDGKPVDPAKYLPR